jgi:hypothetical protein
MSLKDDLLPIVDDARGIAGELGFRPYQVWVRKAEYTGAHTSLSVGTRTVTETRLLVGGQDPKVREVTRKDLVAGTAELVDAEYEIGPLTPEFAGGGVSENTINPDKTSSRIEVTFLLKGPGMPTEGLLCKRVGDHVARPLRYVIRVKSTGRKRP